jgi:hypothetical protein
MIPTGNPPSNDIISEMANKILNEENQLPERIRKLAYQSENGELAWKREDILQVVSILSELDIAVLGGEIWAIDNGNIYGALPLKNGNTSVFHWSIDKQTSEDWNSFVKRSIDNTLKAIKGLIPEKDVKTELVNNLYYNLTLCSKENFNKLLD